MNRPSRQERILRLLNELDRWALFAASAAFTLVASASAAGSIEIPGAPWSLFLFPACLLAISELGRPFIAPQIRVAVGWCLLVLVALEATPLLTRSPIYAVGLPLVIGAGILAARFPAAAIVLGAFLSGIIGTFQAFLGFSPGVLIDLILAAIWFVVFIRLVLGRPYSFVTWPAILGCVLFFGLTAIDLITSESFGVAFISFRTTIWYMLGFLALAYAGWERSTYQRIALGLVGVAIVVSAYAVIQEFTGPTSAERDLAAVTANQINVDPIDKTLRTVGSFQTSHQLAFWVAFMGPFCLGIAMWARGRRRFLALAGAALCFLAIIVSEVRGPMPGFLIGALIVLGIYTMGRAFPGFKLGALALVVVSLLAAGIGTIVLLESDPERVERFERILDPTSDPTFVQRTLKWEEVLNSVEDNPFGRGLGTAGAAQDAGGDAIELAQFNIDNSYLKVAYEQGLFVMALFIFVLVALLLSLIVAALRTESKEAAALGAAAAATLASVMVSFFSGLFIEQTAIVSAWLIVGLGLSYFVARPVPQAMRQRSERALPSAPNAPATVTAANPG